MNITKFIFSIIVILSLSSCYEYKYRYRITYEQKGILLEGETVENGVKYYKIYVWSGTTLPPNYKNPEKTLNCKNPHYHNVQIKIGKDKFNVAEIIKKPSSFKKNITVRKNNPEEDMTSFYLSSNSEGFVISGVYYRNKVIMLSYSVPRYRQVHNNISTIIDNVEVKLPMSKIDIIKIFGKSFKEEKYERE